MNPDQLEAVNGGRPLVFRDATVLTMDGAGVLEHADVLVTGATITAVGPRLPVPDGTVEIDAAGGIVMPGMIDTHRHMWQTAMRAYGADWTLTQYFVWYYLEHGAKFRPEDVRAGNLLSAWDALEAGADAGESERDRHDSSFACSWICSTSSAEVNGSPRTRAWLCTSTR